MLADLVAEGATEVRSAAMGALMMITTVDAGEILHSEKPSTHPHPRVFNHFSAGT